MGRTSDLERMFMRVFLFLLPLLIVMPARADYLTGSSYTASQRRRDEITAKYPPMVGSLQTRDDVENYVQQRDEYDQAVQRLTLDEMRQMREEARRERSDREYDDAMQKLKRSFE